MLVYPKNIKIIHFYITYQKIITVIPCRRYFHLIFIL